MGLRIVVGWVIAALLTACSFPSARPPADFLARRIDPNTHVIVAQVEAYYGRASATWRELGSGAYALDIGDRDPLTNEARTINFLFETRPATSTRPENLAVISELAINGERLAYSDISATIALIARETRPPPRTFFPTIEARRHHQAAAALGCRTDEPVSFDRSTLADLDRAYGAARQWSRYERPGGVLDDGTPFVYIGYAVDDQINERVEFAATEDGEALILLGRREFDESGSSSSWMTGLRACNDTADLMRGSREESPPREIVSIPGIEPGARYADVRAALIASDEYHTVRLHYSVRQCNDRNACETYPELLDCSGTGSNVCRLIFRRRSDGRLLVVNTVGEWSSDFGAETGLHSMEWADLELTARLEH